MTQKRYKKTKRGCEVHDVMIKYVKAWEKMGEDLPLRQ
jgi:hypothetical protein